jgi:DNA-binding MarR family transcriptional regulator
MKVVIRKGLKLDLPLVLAFVAACPGVASSLLLPELQREFRCERRAAQDALAVLIAGGWLERRDAAGDARRKQYVVTPQGEEAWRTDEGWRETRLARWHYSTTSTRARRMSRSDPSVNNRDYV